jgi:excisionase family DNA binding protein
MTTQVLKYVELSAKDRKTAKPLGAALGKVGKGDRVEVRVRRKSGKEEVVSLPPKAAALLEEALGHLLQGERVVLLSKDREISPNEAAKILGISRPLVVHRMDVGDLPFRYVGKHRRAKLKDVLAFKEKVDARQAAVKKLTELGEELWEKYGD